MKKQINDGWHQITHFTSVFTEDGMVTRAMSGNASASVYRKTASGYTNILPMRYDTFRKGWRKDRYYVF